MSIRHAVCERWNKEIVWGLSDSRATTMQNYCMPRLTNEMTLTLCYAALAPTLKIAQQFYTKNGVPIEEDKTLDFQLSTNCGQPPTTRFTILMYVLKQPV